MEKIQKDIIDIYSQAMKLDLYEENFSIKNKINRKFELILGPTNSGKTYKAIEKLKKSESGLYLAPLRLLALEIYQKLNNEGIPCNLLTGEESIFHPDAKFTSSTIEMCNFQDFFETVIIDEVQLINDSSRGYAWTNAILGVLGKNIICLGTSEIKPSLEKIINECKNSVLENIEIKKRLNEISITRNSNIEKGDAIITFSRKNVLYLAEVYRNKGFSTSVIYGALSPEVRKKQIEKFVLGYTDIIISTDAIGLGVNLPIKKIIFSDLFKFDGKESRILTSYEVKQISGRAGRYSLQENGKVTLSNNIANSENYEYLEKSLNSNKDFDKTIYIGPNFKYIEKLSFITKKNNIYDLISIFSKLDTKKQNWKITDLSDSLKIAKIVEDKQPDLKIEDKYTMCFSPLNDDITIEKFSYIIKNKESININDYINAFEFFKDTLEDTEKKVSLISNWAWFNKKYPLYFIINDEEKFNNFKLKTNEELDKKLTFKAKHNILLKKVRKNKSLKNDKDFFKNAIKIDVSIIKEAGFEILNDKEIMSYVIKKNPDYKYLLNKEMLSFLEESIKC